MFSKKEILAELERRGVSVGEKNEKPPGNFSKEDIVKELKRRGVINDESYADTFSEPTRKLKRVGRNLAVGAASIADLPNLASLGLHAAGLKKDPTFYDSVGDKVRDKIDKWTDDDLRPRNKGEEYEDAITEGAAFGIPGIAKKGAAIIAARGLTKGITKGTAKSAASNVGSSAATKAYIDNAEDPSFVGALLAGVAGGNVHNLGKINRAVLSRFIAKNPEIVKDTKALNKALIAAGEDPIQTSVLEGSDFFNADSPKRLSEKTGRLQKIIEGEDSSPLKSFFDGDSRHVKEQVLSRDLDVDAALTRRIQEAPKKKTVEKKTPKKTDIKAEWAKEDAKLIKKMEAEPTRSNSAGYDPKNYEDMLSDLVESSGRSPLSIPRSEIVRRVMERDKSNALQNQTENVRQRIKESDALVTKRKADPDQEVHKYNKYDDQFDAMMEKTSGVTQRSTKAIR